MAQENIKTRFLIISDTHGAKLYDEADSVRQYDSDDSGDSQPPEGTVINGFRRPLPKADVAIHCGDLTKGSGVKEFETTFNLMREIDAPLKLVIAGNHDMALDTAFWETYVQWMEGGQKARKAEYPAKAYEVVERARQDGIHLLDEGTYHFVLHNGAKLSVFASHWTPVYGGWGFQYRGRHDFPIPEGVDLAMTHGPPKYILDRTLFGAKAGCKYLLESISRARPRMHCFGHIHEGWGAKLVTWKDKDREEIPTAPSAWGMTSALDLPQSPPTVDEQLSSVIADLAAVDINAYETPTRVENLERANKLAEERCASVSLCVGDAVTLQQGRQTLFVNAAIMNISYKPYQLPWLVDLELPPPDAGHIAKTEATTAILQKDRRLSKPGDTSREAVFKGKLGSAYKHLA